MQFCWPFYSFLQITGHSPNLKYYKVSKLNPVKGIPTYRIQAYSGNQKHFNNKRSKAQKIMDWQKDNVSFRANALFITKILRKVKVNITENHETFLNKGILMLCLMYIALATDRRTKLCTWCSLVVGILITTKNQWPS